MSRMDWIIVALASLLMTSLVVSGYLLTTTEEHIEGEVIGKELRQAAFMGGTPNFLFINGTGKVSVDAETFHGFEVGDYFNESVPIGDFGWGYDGLDLVDALIPLGVIILTLAIIFPIMSRRLLE